MKQPVRIDFQISWTLNTERMTKDPMARGLKAISDYLPYRVFLTPTNEILSDKWFSFTDPFDITETHFLELDEGQWTISIEDVTGWLSLEINNVKLNGVDIPYPTFNLG